MEQPPLLFGGDADPGVGHVEAQLRFTGLVRAPRHPDDDLALLGELDRVADQVEQDLADPPGIARQPRGDRAVDAAAQLEPLLLRTLRQEGDALLDQLARVVFDPFDVELAGPILLKSRMSLMRSSSASPQPRMVSAYSRCSKSRRDSSRSPVIPITPFMGVRISWLMLARNSDLALAAASAASCASSRWRDRAAASSFRCASVRSIPFSPRPT
jgi:hypothetical protein